MEKFKFIFAAIVAVALASVMALQHMSNESLRRDNDALKQALAELKPLSDASAPTTSDDALNDEQRAELLKLRSDVTQLRSQTNQIGELSEANQKLQVSLREARAIRTSGGSGDDSKKKKPEDALPQDIHPKDSWAFRGYATPDATIESTLWGMLNGDKATILAAFGPDMLPEMEKQLEGKDLKEELGKINMAEFRVLDRRQLSDDEMMLTIYTSRQDENGNTTGNSENTVFQRIAGQWKVTKKQAPEN